jgi:hypothetical protein
MDLPQRHREHGVTEKLNVSENVGFDLIPIPFPKFRVLCGDKILLCDLPSLSALLLKRVAVAACRGMMVRIAPPILWANSTH